MRPDLLRDVGGVATSREMWQSSRMLIGLIARSPWKSQPSRYITLCRRPACRHCCSRASRPCEKQHIEVPPTLVALNVQQHARGAVMAPPSRLTVRAVGVPFRSGYRVDEDPSACHPMATAAPSP